MQAKTLVCEVLGHLQSLEYLVTQDLWGYIFYSNPSRATAAATATM